MFEEKSGATNQCQCWQVEDWPAEPSQILSFKSSVLSNEVSLREFFKYFDLVFCKPSLIISETD